MTLDVLNSAAGRSDRLGIYRPLWDFIYNNQNDAARSELAEIIKRASGNAVRLEDLEFEEYSTEGMSLSLLQRVEEACEVEVSRRPSKTVQANKIY
jgi:hypothetical protein